MERLARGLEVINAKPVEMHTTGKSSLSGTQKWKEADKEAEKSGPHATIYWVKKNKEFQKLKGMGMKQKGTEYNVSGTYSGDWFDNKKDGFGTLTNSKTGGKYEGEWQADKRHGRGTQWEKFNGKLRKVYTGDWKNNKRDVSSSLRIS